MDCQNLSQLQKHLQIGNLKLKLIQHTWLILPFRIGDFSKVNGGLKQLKRQSDCHHKVDKIVENKNKYSDTYEHAHPQI